MTAEQVSAGGTFVVDLVFPEHMNHHGTLFGGRALELMTRAAFIGATRAVRQRLVIAAAQEVTFLSPVHPGELIEAVPSIERIGRSSVRARVDVYAEDLTSGSRRSAIRGHFTLVAVDAAGRPVPVGSAGTKADQLQGSRSAADQRSTA